MGQVFGASKPFPSFKPFKIRHVMDVGKNCPVDFLRVTQDGSQSHVGTSLNFCITLLQRMIVGVLKRFLSGSNLVS